jgi:hypothetical protein
VSAAGVPREQLEHAETLTELALTHLDVGAADTARDLAAQALDIFVAVQGAITPARADAWVALGHAHLARVATTRRVAR